MLVAITAALRLDLGTKEYQVIEFFAGQRRVCRLANTIGLSTAALDVLYDEEASSPSKNAFNINSDSGFVSVA